VGHAKDVSDIASLNEWANKQFDQTLDWSSIEFIRKQWDGKLILKGINDVADARIAATLGVDAIIVSNHGGRQLDGGVAPIDMLAPIVDAVGDKVEVHFDSGIRSGIDVMKALALGARGVYIGRAYVYGLGAGGEAGVTRAIDIIRSELDITMALCGETDVMKVGRHNLVMPVPTHQLPVDEAPVPRKALGVGQLSLPQPVKTNALTKSRRAKR
jgi:L-lactate dehydrogenase (cytochrome)